MSYILDALKKSESERLRRDAPGFADVPARARAAGTPRWIWLLGALLLVNAVVLAGLLFRPAAAPDGVAVVDPRPAGRVDAVPPAASAAAPVAAPTAAAAVEAPAAAATEPEIAATVPRSATQPAATPAVAERPAARSVGPEPAAERPPAAATGLSTLMQLRADGTLALPELHLDIHVYSRKPAERFVFVNMSKYREQDRLAEGPLIREIVPEGVVLEYRDSVFLLPRE